MRVRLQAGLVLALALAVAGCHRAQPNPPAAASGPAPLHLDHAQAGLPRMKLWLGDAEVDAEVCLTIPQLATGLMFREGIGTNDAMLFVFRGADQRAFYMKNVKFPIAAAYIDPEGAVQQIIQLKAMDTNSVPSVSSNIQFVLETAPDFFDRHGVKPGALVTSPQGRLRNVVAPRALAW
jgi:uncharacterized membrane protein (UPF0127 family)